MPDDSLAPRVREWHIALFLVAYFFVSNFLMPKNPLFEETHVEFLRDPKTPLVFRIVVEGIRSFPAKMIGIGIWVATLLFYFTPKGRAQNRMIRLCLFGFLFAGLLGILQMMLMGLLRAR